VVEVADLVFWTCALDFKYKNVQVREDKAIDVCLFYGRIRNSENEAIAKLLLQKSEVMVAFGSYVCFGCIPDLANFTNQIINYFLSTQLLQVIKVSM
jgi:F420-non-reducing hydrogenase small subunit